MKWWKEDWTDEMVIIALLGLSVLGIFKGVNDIALVGVGAFAVYLKGKKRNNNSEVRKDE